MTYSSRRCSSFSSVLLLKISFKQEWNRNKSGENKHVTQSPDEREKYHKCSPLFPKQCSIVRRIYSGAVWPSHPNLLLQQRGVSMCACRCGNKRAAERQRYNVVLKVDVKGECNLISACE